MISTKKTTDGSNALKNVSKVADTFTDTGPKDDLATVDAYREKATTSEKTTATSQLPSDVSKDGAQTLKPSKQSPKDIAGEVKPKNNNILTSKEASDRLNDATSGPVSELDEDSRKALTDRLSTVSGDDTETLQISIGGSAVEIQKKDYKEAKALAALTSAIDQSGTEIIVDDVETKTALAGTILDKAIQLGAVSAVDIALSSIGIGRSTTLMLISKLEAAARVSSLQVIQKIVQRLGSDVVISHKPNLPTMITEYYDWGLGKSRVDYPALRDELIATLDAVDPNWYQKKLNGTWVGYLGPFEKASKKAQILLKMSATHERAARVGPLWPRMSIVESAKNYYPRAAV